MRSFDPVGAIIEMSKDGRRDSRKKDLDSGCDVKLVTGKLYSV